MQLFSALYRTFRSRRLANWLLVAVTVYALVGSLVPQESVVSGPQLEQWRADYPWATGIASVLGLHNAFSTPLFLFIVALLSVTTAVCAWERTVKCLRAARFSLGADEALPAKLAAAPTRVYALDVSAGEDALDSAEQAMRSLGLKTQRDGGVVTGHSAVYAFIGSPLLHWGLVALFIFAGLGQATKWEGMIGVPIGHSVEDREDMYGHVVKGPLADTAGTGLVIDVPEMELNHVVGDIPRDHAPFVRILAEDHILAQGYVFPNSPLQHGPVWIHRSEWGLSAVVALIGPDGVEIGRRNLLYDFESLGTDGLIRIDLDLPQETGLTELTIATPLDPGDTEGAFLTTPPSDPRILAITDDGAQGREFRAGDTIALPEGGYSLAVIDVDRYIRLMVVHDWSIPFVYIALGLATLGMVLALMVSPRFVACSIQHTEDGPRLHALIRTRRIDAAFPLRVTGELEAIAANGEERA